MEKTKRTCAVCFRSVSIRLSTGNPVRHKYEFDGVRGGDCRGPQYGHFEQSTSGTRSELMRAEVELNTNRARLKTLDREPTLFFDVPPALHKVMRTHVERRKGDRSITGAFCTGETVVIPSYETLYETRKTTYERALSLAAKRVSFLRAKLGLPAA